MLTIQLLCSLAQLHNAVLKIYGGPISLSIYIVIVSMFEEFIARRSRGCSSLGIYATQAYAWRNVPCKGAQTNSRDGFPILMIG